MPPKRNTKTKKENIVSTVDTVLPGPEVKRGAEKVDKAFQIAKKVVDEASDIDTNGVIGVESEKKAEKPRAKGRPKGPKATKPKSNGDDVYTDEKPAKKERKAKNVAMPIPSKELTENRKSIAVEKECEPDIAAKSKRGRKKKVAKNEEPLVIGTAAATLPEETPKMTVKKDNEPEIIEDEPPKKKTRREVLKKEGLPKKTVTSSEEPPEERKALETAENKESVEESPVENIHSRKAASKPEPKKATNAALKSKVKAAGRTRVVEKAAELVEESSNPDNAAEVDDEPAPRRKREAVKNEEPSESEPKKKVSKQLQNRTATDYTDLDFATCQSTANGKMWNFKISSWNVDGIRAWVNKGGLEYIEQEKPDIICLQEIKCAQDKLPDEVVTLPGYHPYWMCSDKDGYAGVGIYTKKMAINVQYGLGDEDLDSEGRIITAEYEQFYLISTYVPNAGRKLVTLPKRLKWNEVFRQHVQDLNKKKPVIICGDMNVAHNEIDLTNPKTNKKNAGFTQQERDGMTQLLGDGFVDTFRHLHPEQRDAYTFWTYMMNCRAKNVGWRLDYIIVSERLVPALCDSVIRDQIYGSDHCPITLFLHLSGFKKLSL